MAKFPRRRTRKVDHFERYKEAQRSKPDRRKPMATAPPDKSGRVPKRERAKKRRWVKNLYGLTRREMGAIGAGDMEAPWKDD